MYRLVMVYESGRPIYSITMRYNFQNPGGQKRPVAQLTWCIEATNQDKISGRRECLSKASRLNPWNPSAEVNGFGSTRRS